MDKEKDAADKNISLLGIDLGTSNTYSCFSRIVDRKLGDISPVGIMQYDIEYNSDISPKLPSFIYFPPEGSDPPFIVGTHAKKFMKTHPKRVIRSSKSFIGTDKTYSIDSIKLTPVDAATRILETVKTGAEDFNYHGGNVIVGVPARFTTDQLRDTYNAAQKVFQGEKIRLIEEPVAIALYQLYSELKTDSLELRASKWLHNKRRLLVIDMGGGTLDVTLIEATLQEDKPFDENDPSTYPDINRMSISDYMRCAGDDFDLLVARELQKELWPALSDNRYHELINFFLYHAENIKLRLSKQLRQNQPRPITIRISLPGQAVPQLKTSVWNVARYKKAIKPLLPSDGFTFYHDRINDYHENKDLDNTILRPVIDACMIDGERLLDGKIFDAYIIAGGMASFSLIPELFQEILDLAPITLAEDPKEIVAKGLVVEGFFNQSNKIRKTLARSYGIASVSADKTKEWQEVINGSDKLPFFKKGIEAGYLPAGQSGFVFELGRKNVREGHYDPLRRRVVKIQRPPTKRTLVYLDLLVSEAGFFSFIAKRNDTGEPLEVIEMATDEPDSVENLETLQDEQSPALDLDQLENKTLEIEKKLQIVHHFLPRSTGTGALDFKLFKNQAGNRRLKDVRAKIANNENPDATINKILTSYNSRFNKIDKRLEKLNLSVVAEYLKLLGDLLKEQKNRREIPAEQSLKQIGILINKTSSGLMNKRATSMLINDDKTRNVMIDPLLRLVRYLVSHDPAIYLEELRELLAFAISNPGKWLDHVYFIITHYNHIRKDQKLIKAVIKALNDRYRQVSLHSLGHLGELWFTGDGHIDDDMAIAAGSTMLHLLTKICAKNPLNMLLTPPLEDSMVAKSLLADDLEIKFKDSSSFINLLEKIIFALVYYAKNEKDNSLTVNYHHYLKMLIKQGKLSRNITENIELCLYWTGSHLKGKEMDDKVKKLLDYYLEAI